MADRGELKGAVLDQDRPLVGVNHPRHNLPRAKHVKVQVQALTTSLDELAEVVGTWHATPLVCPSFGLLGRRRRGQKMHLSHPISKGDCLAAICSHQRLFTPAELQQHPHKRRVRRY